MRIRLGRPLLLSTISNMTGGILLTADREITHISTDTRELTGGDLFIPVKGGTKYILEAIALSAFVMAENENAHIKVASEDGILLKIASEYIKTLPYILYKIGITGSVGKTTIKEFLKIILSERFRVHSNQGNLNNEIGLPLSVLTAPCDTQILIMEMGMNHAGEIARLSECLNPNIAIISNVGTSHIGNLGSREAIAKAKLEILSGMNGGELFLPYGEPLLNCSRNFLTVSAESLNADYTMIYDSGSVSLFQSMIKLFSSEFALTEKHHIEDLAFACSVGAYLGLDSNELSRGVSQISIENTRQRLIKKKKYHFLTDFYNSSYESVSALVDSASDRSDYRKKALVLGDVLELGEYAESIHFEIGRLLRPDIFSTLFLFGQHARFIKDGAMRNGFNEDCIFVNEDLSRPDITAEQIKSTCHEDELIFMKASRGVRLERILDYFD